MRRLRILRRRFKGVNFFIIPRVPNKNNVCEFRMDCSSCGYMLSVDMNMAGSVGECPICKESLTIPDALDHLAHTLHLSDDVPVAQIKPQVHSHARDLLSLMCESVIGAFNPPKQAPPAPKVQVQQKPAEETQVRERVSSPKVGVHAAEVAAPKEKPKAKVVAKPKVEEEPVLNQVFLESEDMSDTHFLDEILNTDDDQFDIDDFINNVKRD